jgi:hypothetical protein
MEDILCGPGATDHGYFDRSAVRRLWTEHVSGRENHERLLFPLVNFNLWHQAFFSRSAEPEQVAVGS